MKKLSGELQFSFALTGLVPLLLIGITSTFFLVVSLSGFFETSNVALLNKINLNVVDRLEGLEDSFLSTFSTLESISENLAEDFPQAVINLRRHAPEIIRVLRLSPEGFLLDTYPEENWVVGDDYSKMDFFVSAQKEKAFWSAGFISRIERLALTACSFKGEQGVYVAYIPLEEVYQSMSDFDLGGSSFSGILDDNGMFISHTNPIYVQEREHEASFVEIVPLLVDQEMASLPLPERELIGYFTRIPTTGWILALYHDRYFFMEPMLGSVVFLVLIMGLSVVVSLILASTQGGRIMRNLSDIQRLARGVTMGNYAPTVENDLDFEEVQILEDQFMVMIRAIQEREEKIIYQKNFLEGIIESLTHPFYVIDAKTMKVEMVNKAGRGEYRGVGEHCYKLSSRLGRDCGLKGHVCPVDVIRKSHKSFHTEHVSLNKNGEEVVTEVHSYPVFNKEGEVEKIIEYSLDITSRRKTEQKVLDVQQMIQAIFNSIDSVLFAVDHTGKLIHWNRLAEEFFQLENDKLKGKYWRVLLLDYGLPEEEISGAIGSFESWKKIVKRSTKTGPIIEEITLFPMRRGHVVGGVFRIQDITEKTHMEELMVQSEKMMTIGGLAAGVAHEINNPLAGILQTSELLSKRLTQASARNLAAAEERGISWEMLGDFLIERKVPDLLESITTSGRRVAKIVQELLSFSRKGSGIMSKEDIPQLVEDTIGLASADYQLKKDYEFKKIHIFRSYSKDLPPVPCDKTQVQQVIFNILKNAAQAFHSSKEEFSDPYIHISVGLQAGEQMLISVEDNGPGIPEEIRKKIFEPFFTTKTTGEGTGLGMYVSYFIIHENHKGNLRLQSLPGKGTRFEIELPLTQD